VLVENASLGGGQTLKSQGIIHGGAKYALHGALTGASEAIADMPRRWREALAGERRAGPAGVRLLSDAHYLWSPGTLAGNLTSFSPARPCAAGSIRSRAINCRPPCKTALQGQGLSPGRIGGRCAEPDPAPGRTGR
jgi:glycerol-3-phosphate dehydrogenase